jgi:two-component system sensor histidine kinase QseC
MTNKDPKAQRSVSLRARLLIALMGVIGAVWISVIALTYRDAHSELDELLDSQLAQSARLLVAQSAHELEELDLDEQQLVSPYRQRVAFQVWRAGRDLVLKSVGAPTEPLSSVQQGLSDATVDGTHWRVYSQWDRHRRVLVQVAEDHTMRERLAARIAFNTTIPLLLSVPLLALVIGWAISRALRPVIALGHEVERRRPLALDPIAAAGVPAEITPLVETLNDLFARVRRSFEQERRFTSNAAHELRTPIAALRLQAEVARDSEDRATTQAALNQVIGACDRLTRLISQLLMLARIDEQAAARAPCRLDAIAKSLIAEVAPSAIDANQDISLQAPEPVEIQGNAPLLTAMLRNLLDNALRHGGSPLHVVISLTARDSSVVLTVTDDGKGVSPDTLEILGTPFSRPAGTQAEGSGLGLSLARRIAEWHKGTLEISAGDNGRGLRVSITLPLFTLCQSPAGVVG